MPNYIHSRATDQFLAFLTFLFVAAIYIMGTMTSGAIVLFGVTLLFLICSNFKLEFYYFHVFTFLFCLYCYATSIWAYNYHTALRFSNSIFATLVCLSVMYCHFRRFRDVTLLMKIIMWVGYLVVIYSYLYYGIDKVTSMGSEGGRLRNSFNNVNTLSMLAATVVIINMFFYLFRKATWSLLFLIPAVIFVLSTQSRKGIFVLVVGVFLLYFMNYLRSKSKNLMPFFKFFGIGFLLLLVMLALSSSSAFEGLMERMMGLVSWITGEGEIDASTQARIDLRNIGLEQFKKTPWFGIGMGCSNYLVSQEMGTNAYMHDNYADLATNGGVFGIVLYYSIYLFLLFQERKYYKVDDMANLIIILLLLQFFTDTGAVSYIAKMTYFQFMVYFLHLESCKLKYPQIK